ncbi:MAG: ABC transporter ATP-binding protein, partial [Chloroflexota bacterium]|nr:ABC transporter ATP-binding protein [Chloroflexota bacterium]
SLAVKEREFLTVLGPSGCGKTTLLRSIAGLVPLTGGEIMLDGALVTKPNPRLSMVFQTIGLVPWKTVRENVALGLELQVHHRLDAAQKLEVEYFIELVGLKGFENYYPYQISGGMQQRVGLARALVRKPEVLLMDEPFGALDAQTRAILQDELLRLWGATGATVVFVTHDLDEAIYLSDRVALMSRRPGRLKLAIDVNLPRPRYEYDVRAEPEFVRLRRLAWDNIREEIEQL